MLCTRNMSWLRRGAPVSDRKARRNRLKSVGSFLIVQIANGLASARSELEQPAKMRTNEDCNFWETWPARFAQKSNQLSDASAKSSVRTISGQTFNVLQTFTNE